MEVQLYSLRHRTRGTMRGWRHSLSSATVVLWLAITANVCLNVSDGRVASSCPEVDEGGT